MIFRLRLLPLIMVIQSVITPSAQPMSCSNILRDEALPRPRPAMHNPRQGLLFRACELELIPSRARRELLRERAICYFLHDTALARVQLSIPKTSPPLPHARCRCLLPRPFDAVSLR